MTDLRKAAMTTLNKIRAHKPCADGWKKLLQHLGKTEADDEPLSLRVIFNSNGLDDALWCLRAVEGYDREVRLFGVWCARQVQHLMDDPRSIAALDVAERHAKGLATAYELAAAADAARAAADAAWAAAYAAWDVAYAARDAAYAAWAAEDAAAAAAWDAAVEAAVAARVAAATGAAADVAAAAARAAQRERFVEIFCKEEVQR